MKDAVAGLVAAVVLPGVAVAVAAAVQGHDRPTLALHLAGLAGLWTAFVGTCVLAARMSRSGSLVHEFGLRARPLDLPLGVALGVTAQLVFVPLLYALLKWWAPNVFDHHVETAEELFALAPGAWRWVLVATVAVGAPFVEELFYRGLFQRAVARSWGMRSAVAITMTVFAVTHIRTADQLVELPGLMFIALVLALLAARTGRLGPSVITHMAFNAITVVLVL